MTAIQRALVDDLGNINVHGRSGMVIVFKVETSTEGTYENISASTLIFEVAGKYRLALAAGADNYSRKVTLTRAQVALLAPGQPVQFTVIDETPSVQRNLWAGTITAYGFRTAPSGASEDAGTGAAVSGATVIVRTSGTTDPVVVVRYEGPTGANAIQALIDSGDLPAGSDSSDFLDLLRAPLLAGRLDFSSASNSALLGVI